MLSQNIRRITQDIFLIAVVFAAMSVAYLGFAYTERYRALTRAYLVQAEALIQILNQQAEKAQPAPGK